MIVTYEGLKQFLHIEKLEWAEVVRRLSSIGLEVEREDRICVPRNVVVAKVLKKSQHKNADKLSVCEVDSGNGRVLQIVCGAKNVYAGQYVALALPGAVLPLSGGARGDNHEKGRAAAGREHEKGQNLDSKDSKNVEQKQGHEYQRDASATPQHDGEKKDSKHDGGKKDIESNNGLEIKVSKIRDVESYGMLCSSTELGLAKLNDGIMELDSSIGELVLDRKSTRLNSSHRLQSRMPSSA